MLARNLVAHVVEALPHESFVAVEEKWKNSLTAYWLNCLASFYLQVNEDIVGKLEKRTWLDSGDKAGLQPGLIYQNAKRALQVLQGQVSITVITQLQMLAGYADLVELNVAVIAGSDFNAVAVQAWAALIEYFATLVGYYDFHFRVLIW